MKTIVCFGDSNTYGYDAVTDGRFDENTRYPGVLRHLAGPDYRIIEEGLSGRTTVFRDPINPPIQKACESSPVAGEMGICSRKSHLLREEYRQLAALEGIEYLDAKDADMNPIDYMHLSALGHVWLAHRIWDRIGAEI